MTRSARIPSGSPADVDQLVRRLARPRADRLPECPRPPQHRGAPAGSSMRRYPGSWSAFCPCSRPPCPFPCPVIVPYPLNGRADLPQRERDVDEGEHVVHAMRVLLGAARRQHHRGSRAPRAGARPREAALRNARQRLDAFGPVRGREPSHVVESFGAARDVVGIDERRPRISR